MSKSTKIANTVLTAVLTILSLAWIYPVLMIFFNSLKKESAITTSSAQGRTRFALSRALRACPGLCRVYGVVGA